LSTKSSSIESENCDIWLSQRSRFWPLHSILMSPPTPVADTAPPIINPGGTYSIQVCILFRCENVHFMDFDGRASLLAVSSTFAAPVQRERKRG
jgi:hypothetical protein